MKHSDIKIKTSREYRQDLISATWPLKSLKAEQGQKKYVSNGKSEAASTINHRSRATRWYYDPPLGLEIMACQSSEVM